jgi:hypothetical protein
VTANNKIYDRTTVATLDLSNATLSGWLPGDSGSIDSDYDANFISPNVGDNIAVIVDYIGLQGPNAQNYQIISPVGLTANILPLDPPPPTPSKSSINTGAIMQQVRVNTTNAANNAQFSDSITNNITNIENTADTFYRANVCFNEPKSGQISLFNSKASCP